MGLAGIFENNKFNERANAQYETIGESSAYYRRARLEEALNLNELDKVEEAKASLRALIDSEPDDITAYTTLGSILSQHEDYREAAAVYDAAVTRLPQSAELSLEPVLPPRHRL